jgi:hypothetical protein
MKQPDLSHSSFKNPGFFHLEKKAQKQTSSDEKKILEAELSFRAGEVSIQDVIAPSGMQVKTLYLQLGNMFVRTLFITTYPRYMHVGWFASIINLAAELDVALYFYPVKSDVILKQLRNKVGNLEAQLLGDAEKGAPRDPMRETALKDIESLRDDITQGVEHFFQVGVYITMYGREMKELDELTDRVEFLLGSKLVFSKKALFESEQGFNSTLPLGNDELAFGVNMNTSPAAASFPFVSSELTSDSGILYGINRHNNSLILFDRFTLPNANAVVFATSGAGKSYSIKLEVLRSLMLGTEVIIIDPEREYQHLSEAVGGTYVNVSLNSDSKINPFDLPSKVPEGSSTSDIIRSAIITLKGLFRIMLGKMTTREDSILDQALLQVYAKKDISADSDLARIDAPIMSDLKDILDGMEGGEDLALRLEKYTDGTFAGLFNSPTTIDTNNQLVVFSVRDLEDELRPMAIYTIINHIWNKVRSESKKRILVIDEAWWMMQHEDSAKFMYALVKRCRKYYLGVTTITQDVNDFLLSPYGQAIVTNSSLQLLLKQSPAAIDIVAKTFLLTEGERYLLLEARVGEGIFFAGAKHAAIKVVASYAEDQIITTDPRQLLEIEAAKQEFADAQDAESAEEEPISELI